MRATPNPLSKILSNAVVGGAGSELPLNANPPKGMAVVLLYVPVGHIEGKTPIDIQEDIGLPWSTTEGKGVWFDELDTKST